MRLRMENVSTDTPCREMALPKKSMQRSISACAKHTGYTQSDNRARPSKALLTLNRIGMHNLDRQILQIESS